MTDRAAALHALVCKLRESINTAALAGSDGPALTGDEIFAAIMFVLCESIARTRQPVRDALVKVVIENIEAAVMFEATGKDFDSFVPPGTRRQ